ncbi:MAG: hypothetical protein ACRYFV_01545 [Janthinobacterium lividum]
MAALLFALYSILSGGQQGIITWLFREYVPESRKDWVHAALHYGGVVIYLVLVAYVVYQSGQPWRVLLIEAALIRALLFDPSLSLSQSWFNYREGRPAESLFKVGTIAVGDQAIRWAADKLGMEPEHLRCILWVVCLALVVAAFIFGPLHF